MHETGDSQAAQDRQYVYRRSTLGNLWVRINEIFGIYTSPLLALLLVTLIGRITSPRFLTLENITNLSAQASMVGIMTVGMTLVMLTGGIDLSVGNLLSMFAVLGAMWFQAGDGMNIWLILVLLFLIGAAIGALQGTIIAVRRAAPFIVTLAVMSVGQSMALVFSNGSPITGIKGEWIQLGFGTVGFIPISFLIMLAWFLLGDFILNRTALGRHMRAIGGNERMARLSGVPVARTKMVTYMINGICVALAAFIFCGRVSVGDPYGGRGLELDVITATVVGGTSLFGAVGSLWGSFIGVFVVMMINNVINYASNTFGLPPFFQPVAKGVIILIAVMLYRRRSA